MSRFTKIFSIFLVIVFLFPVLTGADTYFFEKGLLPPYPSLVLLLAIFTPLILKNLAYDRGQEIRRIYSNTGWVTVPFGMLALVCLVWGTHPDAYWVYDGRIIFMDLYNWTLLMLSIGIASSRTIRKYYRLIFLFMFLGATISIWVDMLSPAYFSKLTHRAAGFYNDSNLGAFSTVLLAIGAINWKKQDGLNLFLLIFVPIAIYPTLSVGSFFVFLVTLIYYLALNLRAKGNVLQKLAWIVTFLLLIFVVVIPFLIEISNTSTMLDNRTSKNRIEDIAQLSQGDISFATEHDRLGLIYQYWDIIADAPIVGHGTGFIHTPDGIRIHGPHNMFLKHWVEQGILGIFLYLLLLGGAFFYFMTLKDRRGMIFLIAIIIEGFLDHNLLWNRTFVVLLGIFGTLSYLEKAESFPIKNFARKWALP